jgi:glycosyltransferase involved in cell wall biosynthesis
MQHRKLAIVSTHPIQYYAPVFRALAADDRLDVRVFFTWSQAGDGTLFDAGFGTEVKWDIPLLDGYAHQFVRNVAKRPGSDHFGGIRNPTLIDEIEAWRADAVLVYGWSCHSHLQAIRHFRGRIPVLFRGDSTLLDESPWWRRSLRRAFLRWLYAHIDMAIAVGSNSRDYFAWCGVPPGKIAVAPHSIDTLRFSADASTKENLAAEWRRRLGIPAEAVVFLYAGKLQLKKNPGLLLAAFSTLEPGPHLIFVGNGAAEDELRSIAAAHPRVHFLPFQNQSLMPVVYRLGDVYALPSRGPGETWGLALNEAMAAGRATIASSKVGGARDLIRTGINGWIFDSGDREALENTLRQAVEGGHARLTEMGNAGLALSGQWSTEAGASGIRRAVLSCWASSMG